MGVREGVGNRRCFLKDLDLDGGGGEGGESIGVPESCIVDVG